MDKTTTLRSVVQFQYSGYSSLSLTSCLVSFHRLPKESERGKIPFQAHAKVGRMASPSDANEVRKVIVLLFLCIKQLIDQVLKPLKPVAGNKDITS